MEDYREELIYKLSKNFDYNEVNLILDQVDSVLCNYNITKKSLLPEVSNPVFFVEGFIKSKKISGIANTSIETYVSKLKDFISSLEVPVQYATTDDIRLYLYNASTIKNWSDVTVNHSRIVINQFYKWMVYNKYMETNPCEVIKRGKIKVNQRVPFTEKELESIRYVCRNSMRDSALIEFMYSTGCRAGEVVKVKISDIDFDKNTVTVTGKGNKTRNVYLSEAACGAIHRYLDDRKYTSEYLFVGMRGGKPLSVDGIEHIFDELGKKANISRKIKPHDMRHTTATRLLAHGMPLEEIQKILGHSNIGTTLIYADIDDSKLQYDHSIYI